MCFKKTSVILAFAFGAIAALPTGATAEEQQCAGELGAVTVDNVRVPANATCGLDGTYIQGSLKVETGAALDANEILVIGNVQGENAKVVMVTMSQIGGSFQIKQGGVASLSSSTVSGDVQLELNGGSVNVFSNRVGGSVQVFKNSGGASIAANSIDGNLQCKENDPPPAGGDNVFQGNAEDQCTALATGGAPVDGGLAASLVPTGSDTGHTFGDFRAGTPSAAMSSGLARRASSSRTTKAGRHRCKRAGRRVRARGNAVCRRQSVRTGDRRPGRR